MESDNYEVMLFCVLSRINLLINSLPDYIQECLEEAKYDIISVLRKLGFNIDLKDSSFNEPDLIVLYNELVAIEESLIDIIPMLPNYSSLEEAKINVSLAIKGLIEMDSSVKEHHGRMRLMRKDNV